MFGQRLSNLNRFVGITRTNDEGYRTEVFARIKFVVRRIEFDDNWRGHSRFRKHRIGNGPGTKPNFTGHLLGLPDPTERSVVLNCTHHERASLWIVDQ